LDVVADKEKDEIFSNGKNSHPTKYNNNHEQPPRVDFIESWFQIIVGKAMQLNFGHI
jgi:hypothetical protein